MEISLSRLGFLTLVPKSTCSLPSGPPLFWPKMVVHESQSSHSRATPRSDPDLSIELPWLLLQSC